MVRTENSIFNYNFLKLNSPCAREPSNALWSAAKEGRSDVIDYLLDNEVKPLSPDPIFTYARLPSGVMQPDTLIRLIECTFTPPLLDRENSSLMSTHIDTAVPDIEGQVWVDMPSMAWAVYTAPGLPGATRRVVYGLLHLQGANINATCFVPGHGPTSPLLYAGTSI
jgi:hypothetical protein